MSRYFARLAQRTGLAAARNIANAAARDTSADIVEQEHYVDARAPGPATVPTAEAATPAAIQRRSRTNSRTSATIDAAAAEMPVPPAARSVSTPAPSVESPSAAMREAATDKAVRAGAIGASSTSSPREPSNREAIMANDAAPEFVDGEAPTSALALAGQPRPIRAAATAELRARESSRTRALAHEHSRGTSREDPFVRRESNQPSAMVSDESPPPLAEFGFAYEPRSGTRTTPGARAPARTGAAPTVIENNVEVRIGAVRLEVHAPTPASPGAPTPAPVPAPTPRRFTPSRYHLRG